MTDDSEEPETQPSTRLTRAWTPLKILTGVLFSVFAAGAAILLAGGIMVGSCWHGCSTADRAGGIGVTLAGFAVAGVVAFVGLLLLRRSWKAFGLYLMGLVVLAKLLEYVVEHIH